MKKMKFLLGAVALMATLSAFAVSSRGDCPDSYVYKGLGDPRVNPQNADDFVLSSSVGGCNDAAVYSCLWIKTGEDTFMPCPDSPTGKYTESRAHIAK